ncbi:MAG: biotin/lipoyl-containing protein [Sandaracinaceae bacterium]
MIYTVSLEGDEREIDVTIAPDGSVLVAMGGERVPCDARVVPGGVSLSLGGRVFDLVIGGADGELQVASGERRGTVQVSSPRSRRSTRPSAGVGGGGSEIRAPMPGRVVKILVAAGQAIEAGAPCVVIEAMKMENELRAPRAATVKQVHVAEGGAVDARALLVTFD